MWAREVAHTPFHVKHVSEALHIERFHPEQFSPTPDYESLAGENQKQQHLLSTFKLCSTNQYIKMHTSHHSQTSPRKYSYHVLLMWLLLVKEPRDDENYDLDSKPKKLCSSTADLHLNLAAILQSLMQLHFFLLHTSEILNAPPSSRSLFLTISKEYSVCMSEAL